MSRDISPAERELELDEYHHMLGTFGDYAIWYLYGYTVLSSRPYLGAVLALINAYAQIRVDAWNISVVSGGLGRRTPRTWELGRHYRIAVVYRCLRIQ